MSEAIRSPLSENEIEFLAEDELITITPAFHCGKAEYGPFKPNFPTEVPLWLAIDLKRKKRCKIQPPPWLSVENLRAVFELEKEEPAFSTLPFHYIEIGTLLLSHATDDIHEHQSVRSVLNEIQILRMTKIRNGLMDINQDVLHLKLNNISSMELNTIRPFLVTALDSFHKISLQSAAPPPSEEEEFASAAADEDEEAPQRRLRRFQ